MIKSGYLLKHGSGSAFTKKFFVLSTNKQSISTLRYFNDQPNNDKIELIKGEFLLLSSSTIEIIDTAVHGMKFPFRITNQFDSYLLAAKSSEDRQLWTDSIKETIEMSKLLNIKLEGYIYKRSRGMLQQRQTKKYFVFNRGKIIQFASNDHQVVPEFEMTISYKTLLEKSNDKKLKLQISNANGQSIILQWDRSSKDAQSTYMIWKETIMMNIESDLAAFKADENKLNDDIAHAVFRGELYVRPPTLVGGAKTKISTSDHATNWPICTVLLSKDSEIIVLNSNNALVDRIEMHMDNVVCETNLKPHAWELVTSKKIVHFAAISLEESTKWLKILRETIDCVDILPSAEVGLFNLALELIPSDELYTVEIKEAKPLGIVLERSKEWALIKTSNFNETGVKVGSVLHAVNGHDVMRSNHSDVLLLLRDWRPPLSLTFRSAPEKSGWLQKRTISYTSNTNGTVANSSFHSWKLKYIVIREGRLIIKDSEDDSSNTRGEIPFMATSITLLSFSETGKFYCFKLNHGVMSIVLQASSIDEMNEWAGLIYHSISIANGGFHILKDFTGFSRDRSSSIDTIEAMSEILDIEDDYEIFEDSEMMAGMVIDKGGLCPDNIIASEKGKLEAGESVVVSPGKRKREDDLDEVSSETATTEMRVCEDVNLITGVQNDVVATEEFGSGTIVEGETENIPDDMLDKKVKADRDEEVFVMGNTEEVIEQCENMQPIANQSSSRHSASIDDEDCEFFIYKLFNLPLPTPITAATTSQESLSKYLSYEPATSEDLAGMFNKVSKAGLEGSNRGRYLNVMQFSSIWRMITGEKGNLFKEMQMYNKFDVSGCGAMNEEDFIGGWISHSRSRNDDDCILRRIRCIVGKRQDNMST